MNIDSSQRLLTYFIVRRFWGMLLLMLWPLMINAEQSTSLPVYGVREQGLSGTLSLTGSDTLARMSSAWVEEFKILYPNIQTQLQASGSSTAPIALMESTAQFGVMSRVMRQREIDAFQKKHGYKPIALRVALDAIGIIVNSDNPIVGLNLSQIDSIFSSTLRCGANKAITTWQELGNEAPWAKRKIQLFGRNAASGTYSFFKQHALCQGDFKTGVNEQPGSASVVQAVASSISAIGYAGIGYQIGGARFIPIAVSGDDYISASHFNIINGRYPLARHLYVYVNKHPLKPLSPIEEEFIRFIYSKQGQNIVAKEGYIAVDVSLAEQELLKIDIKDIDVSND